MHIGTSLSISTTLLVAALMPAMAADMVVSDLRLGAGILSPDYSGSSTITVTDNHGSLTTDRSSNHGGDADSNWRGQLQYVAGSLGDGGGLIWGVGVAVNRASWDHRDQDAHVTTPTIDVLLGYGYAFTPSWHVELTPFAGYGRAYYSVNDHGAPNAHDDWNNYLEYGAKLGTYFAIANNLVVGIEVPYLVGRFDPKYTYADNNNSQVTADYERTNSGLGVLATVGMRF